MKGWDLTISVVANVDFIGLEHFSSLYFDSRIP